MSKSLRANDTFEQGIKVLRTYRRKHGDCRVVVGYQDPSGFHLYNWLRVQRQNLRKGRLPRDRVAKLRRLGVNGLWLDQMYSDHIALLMRAKEITGTANIRTDFVFEGVQLGQWLAQAKHRARDGVVPTKWVDVLNSIGVDMRKFGAKAKSSSKRSSTKGRRRPMSADSFVAGILLLKRFKAEFGHVRVPQKEGIFRGFNLGSWLHWQRRNWREGKLSQDRIDALSSLGVLKRY